MATTSKIPLIYTLSSEDQEQFLGESFSNLISDLPKRDPQLTVKEALIKENVPPFYPKFTPLLTKTTTDATLLTVSTLDKYTQPSSEEVALLNADNKNKQQERTKFLKNHSNQYQEVIVSADKTLCSMIDEISSQFKGLVDYLNEGTPTSLPFSFGPFDPTIDIVPFGGEEKPGKGGVYSSAGGSTAGPYRAAVPRQKKTGEGDDAFGLANIQFGEVDEGGEKIPMMTLSIEDLIAATEGKSDDEKNEDEGEGTVSTAPEDAGGKKKKYLIPRYSIVHRNREDDAPGSSPSGSSSSSGPSQTQTTEQLYATDTGDKRIVPSSKKAGGDHKDDVEKPKITPIIKNYENTRWMLNRIEPVSDAFQRTLNDAEKAKKVMVKK